MFHYLYAQNLTAFAIILLGASFCLTVFHAVLRSHKVERIFISICTASYIALIIYATLFSREKSENAQGYSLIPFITYYKAETENVEFYREAFMNVALFFPLGCFSYCYDIKGKRKWTAPIISALIFSSIIEIIQYAFKLGYAEVDDVIHNTAGVIIGILVCTLKEKILKEAKSILYDNK